MRVFFGIVVVLFVVLVATLGGSFYTVDQGERAVLLSNGAYQRTEGPGFHFKTPWIESVEHVSVQQQTVRYDKVNSYSADQQPADVDLSVTLQIDPARVEDVYARFGSADALISRAVTPRVRQEFKVVFGRYTAASAIQDRAKLNADVYRVLAAALSGEPEVQLLGVQIENIEFSAQYVQSIEQRMQAEIEVQKIQQNAAREKVQAEITVIKARAEADATLAQNTANAQAVRLSGQAQADATLAQARSTAEAARLVGEANATAIRAQADALGQNPLYVTYATQTRWNGILPTTMLPGAAVPLVGLK